MASFFDEIGRNNLTSALLLMVFSLFFIVVIYMFLFLLGGGGILSFAFVFVLVALYAMFTYYMGDSVVLAVSGAKEADPKQYSVLYSTVEGLASATQIKMPKVYVIQDPSPNAFATGRKSRPSIAVTTGLLAMANREELEGVIAHEISHVADNDILVMTISIAFAGVIGLVSVFIRNLVLFGGLSGNRDRNGSNVLLIVVAVAIGLLAPVFALLIKLAISRKREYMADANGARITRNPAGLASALKKIEAYTARPNVPGVVHANEVTAPMYFANPFTAKNLMGLFSTHPPIEDRIKRLQAMY